MSDAEDGFLRGKRYLILDRDTKYSDEFRGIVARAGIQLALLPPRSPNLNAFAERFVRSIKSECLNRMIFFGQHSLQNAIPNSCRITMLSEIIRASKTGLCGPAQSSRHLGRCIGARVSVECSIITTAPLPEQRRFCFWTYGIGPVVTTVRSQTTSILPPTPDKDDGRRKTL